MALATSYYLLNSVILGGIPESVTAARAFIREALGENHPAVEIAMLLGSELVSNAIRHSRSGRRDGGRLTVAVVVAAGVIHVDVIDEGSTDAIPEIPLQIDELSESGRGLWLVRELSSAWGWRDRATGRVVWFEVNGPDGAAVPDHSRSCQSARAAGPVAGRYHQIRAGKD
ncbi:ATP-binding protein [Sphaerimonospora thailandensis]|uniref:Histidine kinase/HSP90-like ATPase domain-containing protein n=1 Tax=Sphaerimonospora thailandensis TaxID=795644 RepID=A0A8J3VYV8_9ACTN|nr:ATP-binding protein [Sphaerimonospora thailandensis]GIH69887.1 hypothetical protein Mth01_21400 [Sphaerimonospora thailandensis]